MPNYNCYFSLVISCISYAYSQSHDPLKELVVDSASSENSYKEIQFDIYSDADPYELADLGCRDDYESCYSIVKGVVELKKKELFGMELNGWKWNELCQ